jgi:hypothetical protein
LSLSQIARQQPTNVILCSENHDVIGSEGRTISPAVEHRHEIHRS